MSSRPLALILAFCILPWLGSCAAPNSRGTSANPDAEARGRCQRIHQALNRYRTQHGLPALTRVEGMDEVALDHCRYLLNHRGNSSLHGQNVNHKGIENRANTCYQRFGMDGYGENVAAITSAPADPVEHVMLMWKTSFPHDQTMLDDWTHTGISMLIDRDGAMFITQTFGKR